MTDITSFVPRRKLGDVLRERIDAQAQKTADGDLAKAQEAGRLAKANFEAVTSFFENVKVQLVKAITEGKTKHEVLIGRSDTGNHNAKIHGLLLPGGDQQDMQKGLERPSHPFHGTWTEFVQWAAEENLAVKLDYRWDGGGMHSWNALVIQPAPVPAPKPRGARP